jgi:hypothetical protein
LCALHFSIQIYTWLVFLREAIEHRWSTMSIIVLHRISSEQPLCKKSVGGNQKSVVDDDDHLCGPLRASVFITSTTLD